jgi:hypothetical protein
MHLVGLFCALDGSKTSYYWVYLLTINNKNQWSAKIKRTPSQQMYGTIKNEGGISRARVNSVAWITNPATAMPPSQIAEHFIQYPL